MSTVAILTAAGSGSRLGLPIPKALVELRGVPLVLHAAQRLAAAGCVDHLTVTVPAAQLEIFDIALRDSTALAQTLPIYIVPGGPTRQASVAAALAVLDESADVVLVHDAARPLASPDLVSRVERAVRSGRGAVVPGMPVSDTVKRVGAIREDGLMPVKHTIDRSKLRAIQTPQGFARDLLERAHAAGAARADDPALAASDDAGLVEDLGERVWVIEGDQMAMKVTTPLDLAVAEWLLTEQPPGAHEIARSLGTELDESW